MPPDFIDGKTAPTSEQRALMADWDKGTHIYHDEYGYGVIISQSVKNDEVVISIQFENSGVKQFMPKYQSSALLRIGEED
jgi:DNA helicase-2/ATP-dependent DNA helicase PcrA